MLLWAGFQVICVPVILLEGRMWMVTVAYCGYILVLLAAATGPVFPAVRTLRAVREAKPEKAEDYFVGAGWCAFAGAVGIGSADGLR